MLFFAGNRIDIRIDNCSLKTESRTQDSFHVGYRVKEWLGKIGNYGKEAKAGV